MRQNLLTVHGDEPDGPLGGPRSKVGMGAIVVAVMVRWVGGMGQGHHAPVHHLAVALEKDFALVTRFKPAKATLTLGAGHGSVVVDLKLAKHTPCAKAVLALIAQGDLLQAAGAIAGDLAVLVKVMVTGIGAMQGIQGCKGGDVQLFEQVVLVQMGRYCACVDIP